MPRRPFFAKAIVPSLDRNDVGGIFTLGTLADVEFDLLSLGQGAEPFATNRGIVDKEILASVIRGNEAVSFGVIEPLHGACFLRHNDLLLSVILHRPALD